jgi:ferrous iron transport protein A
MGRGRNLWTRRRGSRGQVRESPATRYTVDAQGGGKAPVDGVWLPLGAVAKGGRAMIEGFSGGHMLVSRLSALGFTPGTEVEMIQNFGHGPVIVYVRDTRIALGRGEANKVRVRPSPRQE